MHQVNPNLTALHRFGQPGQGIKITLPPFGGRRGRIGFKNTGAPGQSTKPTTMTQGPAKMSADKTTGTAQRNKGQGGISCGHGCS